MGRAPAADAVGASAHSDQGQIEILFECLYAGHLIVIQGGGSASIPLRAMSVCPVSDSKDCRARSWSADNCAML